MFGMRNGASSSHLIFVIVRHLVRTYIRIASAAPRHAYVGTYIRRYHRSSLSHNTGTIGCLASALSILLASGDERDHIARLECTWVYIYYLMGTPGGGAATSPRGWISRASTFFMH